MAKNPMINPGGPKDPVTNPAHYTSTKISPIEVIMDWNLPFDVGNALKYVGRHRMKGGIEDLKKALWYLDHAIERLEKDKESVKLTSDMVTGDWSMDSDVDHNLRLALYHISPQRSMDYQLGKYRHARTFLRAHILMVETSV